jgi:hypothetical protein
MLWSARLAFHSYQTQLPNTAACWVSCVNFVLDDVGRLGFQMQDENSMPDSVLADTSGVMRCCRPQGMEDELLVVHFMSCPASKQ